MPQAVTGRGFSNTYKNHMNRFLIPNLDLSLNFLDIPQISNLKERWDFYFCKTLPLFPVARYRVSAGADKPITGQKIIRIRAI